MRLTPEMLKQGDWRLTPCPADCNDGMACYSQHHTGGRCVEGCVPCVKCSGRGHMGTAIMWEDCEACDGSGHRGTHPWPPPCDGCCEAGCVDGKRSVPPTHPIYADGYRAIVIEVPLGGEHDE